MLEINFAEGRLDTLPDAAALALLVAEDGDRPALFNAIDAATGGAVTRSLQSAEFTFGPQQDLHPARPRRRPLARVVLVGLGRRGRSRDAGAGGGRQHRGGRAAQRRRRIPVGGRPERRAGGPCGARSAPRRLPLRPLPHPRDRRGQAPPRQPHGARGGFRHRRGGACGLAGARGGGARRRADPRPRQRARQRAEPAGVRRADRGARQPRPRDRDARAGRDGAARLRGRCSASPWAATRSRAPSSCAGTAARQAPPRWRSSARA